MEARTVAAYECDHMRPVVFTAFDPWSDRKWYHIQNGRITSSECEAGVYRVTATYTGEHYTSNLVLEEGN